MWRMHMLRYTCLIFRIHMLECTCLVWHMHILLCICLRCAGLLSRMSETIDRVFLDAGQKSQGLGLVGLVGGSSRLPMVQQMLRRKFGQAKVRIKPPNLNRCICHMQIHVLGTACAGRCVQASTLTR